MTTADMTKLEEMIATMKAAQKIYATFTQEQVDKIFYEASKAANEMRIPLAKQAVAETGMGIVEDKVIKNHFASEIIYNQFKDVKTCGVIDEDKTFGVKKIAEPIGLIAGVVPTTNPTSTAIFKTLIALKTRNAIIFSPHPRAKNCTRDAAMVVANAAVKAGAPAGLVQVIEEPTVELSGALMKHPEIDLILATGGPGMVKAAYSSGKPALGVGAGNTPAIIDETANIQTAVNTILVSKTFDNGMICASEQSVVVVADKYDAVKKEFKLRGAHLLTKAEKEKVGKVILNEKGALNAAIVGQSAYTIAQLAGVEVPVETKVLIGEASEVVRSEPFAHEKLSPVLAMYKAKTFEEALDIADALIDFGGLGHTSTCYTDPHNEDRILAFGSRMKTCRTLINMPATQGAIGDLYNFKIAPSLTLGCGSWGGNSVSENVGVKHLMNVKTVAERRENMLWYKVPAKMYFKFGCLPIALKELNGKNRAVIVTDQALFDLGYTDRITKVLEEMGITTKVFSDVKPDPDVSTVNKGVEMLNAFKPDVIIALGGGSPMDAAKVMWLMYEQPETKFEDLAMRFFDIEKRICKFPALGKVADLVTIPTTSGTGSEVTPFAVVTDDATGAKYPIADYSLTPTMAIVDPELVMSMPKGLTAFSGIDVLTHALEAMVSICSSEYTDCQALEAARLIFKYLPASYANGAKDPEAREKVHYAACLAGMAFANAFLGVCHSMAHKLGARHHVPHGLANALLINETIRFNATDKPVKMGTFSQYTHPQAIERYARVADYIQLGGKTNEEKVELLIKAIDDLKAKLNIPTSIKEAGVPEAEFMATLDQMSEDAFDDQCTGANPRYPLISEIKEMYLKAYGA